MVELKVHINKFAVSLHKCETVLFLGNRYLRFYEANFTNKIVKETSLNIVPMKVEKENNFVDIDVVPRTDISVIITDTN